MTSISENFIVCDCRHCGNGIEFDAYQLEQGESRIIDCPHCGLETSLFRAPKLTVFRRTTPLPAPPVTPAPPAIPVQPAIPQKKILEKEMSGKTIPQTGIPGKKRLTLPFYIMLICFVGGLGTLIFFAKYKFVPATHAEGYDNGYEVGLMGYVNGLPQLDDASLNGLATMLSVTNRVPASNDVNWIAAFTNGYLTAFTEMKGPFGKGYIAGWLYRKQGNVAPADEKIQALARQATRGGADALAWESGFKLGLGQPR